MTASRLIAPPTARHRLDPSQALGLLPWGLKDEVIRELNGVVRNFREGRWQPAELDGGRLCEVVYTILRGHVDGVFPPAASRPSNMVDSCKSLEKADPNHFPQSVRITMPRALVALYELRNNRGVGHVGGDVDSNHMDASLVLAMSKWLVAELVRIFHDVDTETATAVVDALIDREVPLIWSPVTGRRRLLDPSMKKKDQALAFVYGEMGTATMRDLAAWMEMELRYLKRDVLRPLHLARLIDLDEGPGLVRLSPTGQIRVERHLVNPLQAAA